MYLLYQIFCFFCRDYRIDHTGLLVCVTSGTFKTCRRMIGKFENLLINLIRLLRDNEQRMLLISLMQHLNHLSRSKLEDNRVKRSVPSKEQTCHCQDHCISTQNIIPDIPAIFLGKINRNKVRSTCTGITDQTETDTEAIDQTAKDTDQQCIISDRLTGNNIRKQTGKHDHTDRTYRKFLSDKFQTNKYRNRVQQYINQRIRNCNPHKCLKNVLEQQSKSCKSSRKKTACTNKCLNIQRHDRCSQNRTAVTLGFMF